MTTSSAAPSPTTDLDPPGSPPVARPTGPSRPPTRPKTAPAAEADYGLVLRIEPWPDPVVERIGYDPRSAYVDTFWLSILGPSTTWLLRRLAQQLDENPDGFELDCREMAIELGLGPGTGKRSIFVRSLNRSAKFGMTQRTGFSLYMRRRVPPLSQGQVQRLPPRLRALHQSWSEASDQTSDPHRHGAIDRARRLALTLFQLGEDAATTEQQLHTWHFHPSIAWDATQWALERHHRAAQAATATTRRD